jgi:hypothetical protein
MLLDEDQLCYINKVERINMQSCAEMVQQRRRTKNGDPAPKSVSCHAAKKNKIHVSLDAYLSVSRLVSPNCCVLEESQNTSPF